MELFSAQKVAEMQSNSTRRCRVCNQPLLLTRTVVVDETGDLIHLFECKCGERIWEQ